jgi:DNA-directed RNA polymerase specialized sigma24 family protein
MNKNGDEICQELDITPTNFWQIVHRAKLQLRNCVKENWFENE